MATEWSGALLVAGAVVSAATGGWTLWQAPLAAQRARRRAMHERVRLPLDKRLHPERLRAWLPAGLGALALYLLVRFLAHRTGLAVLVALGGVMLPGWLLEWRETRRVVQLSEQLVRVMGMVSTSLRRGTPLEVALAEAAASLPDPLGPVLRHLAQATTMGVTLAQAVEQLRSLPAVAGSPDFQVFATEMVVCHERGANIVQVFDALREVLAARRKYREQVREQMGQHLLQSLVIAGVGLLVLLVYSRMARDGLEPLLSSLFGQMILAGSLLGNTFLIRLTHLSLLRQTRKV